MIQRMALSTRFAGFQSSEPGAFWRLTGVLFLVYFSTGLWNPLLSVHIKSLGAGTRDIGLVLGAFQATSLVSQYWWGRYSDRLGRRKPLLLFGTGGLAISYLAIASLRQWEWLFAVRLLEGVALAAYSTGSLALIGDLLEDQSSRGRLMGTYRTFGSLAFAVAALSGGLLADRWTTRLPLVVAAGCYLLAFALVTQIGERRRTSIEAAKARMAGGRPAERIPAAPDARPASIWPFLSMPFIWSFGMGAVVSLWPLYMESIGYSKTAVGSLWGLAAMGEVPCLLLAGYLADRWGRKPVLITGIVLMAGVFVGYTVSTSLIWLIVVQMVRSLAYSCFEAPALLLATELGVRQHRGRLASLYHMATGGGGISGSVVGGAVAQEVGLVMMYRTVVAFMLAAVFIAGRKLREGVPRDPVPTV